MTIPYHAESLLKNAEQVAAVSGDLTRAYEELRTLSLADFCNLHIHSLASYPHLAELFPSMPSDDVQKKWVGDFGRSLMLRSCNLARLFDLMSWQVTGSGLRNKRILDYGCGWGRLLRIMNYYSPAENVDGVDPMLASLDHCRDSGLPNTVSLIDPRPAAVPDANKKYDFAFAFSVFTHTPFEVTNSVLKALKPAMAKNSTFVVTIRSIEWVSVRDGVWSEQRAQQMRDDFYKNGYAFQTWENDDSLDAADYGDTIMSTDYLSALAKETGWEIAMVDRDMSEPFQIAVALTPTL